MITGDRERTAPRRPWGESETLSHYMEEISKIPLLSRERELEVAAALTQGREDLLVEHSRIPEAVEEICIWARRAVAGEVSFERYFDHDEVAPGRAGREKFLGVVARIEKRLRLMRRKRLAGVRSSEERIHAAIVADVLALHPTEPIIARAEERVLSLLRDRHVPVSVMRDVARAGRMQDGITRHELSVSHGNGAVPSNGNGIGNGHRNGNGNGNGNGDHGARSGARDGDKAHGGFGDPWLEGSLLRIRSARQRFEDSRRILTESNLRLAITVAKLYRNRGLPLSDLIQEGNLGLIRACDRFDSRKGYRFSTYAVYWIRQSINRALPEQSRTLRVPPHLTEILGRYVDAKMKLQGTLGREPSEEEIDTHLGIARDRLARALALPLEATSIDRPLSDDGPSHWDLPDRQSPSPMLTVQRRRLEDAAEGIGGVLSHREAEVIRMRFGLCGQQEMTLEEIGARFSVTRERVRQIQAEALRKLRFSEFAAIGAYARASGAPSVTAR